MPSKGDIHMRMGLSFNDRVTYVGHYANDLHGILPVVTLHEIQPNRNLMRPKSLRQHLVNDNNGCTAAESLFLESELASP